MFNSLAKLGKITEKHKDNTHVYISCIKVYLFYKVKGLFFRVAKTGDSEALLSLESK
jgi:hypothetical protein